jgi:hypothetical protein
MSERVQDSNLEDSRREIRLLFERRSWQYIEIEQPEQPSRTQHSELSTNPHRLGCVECVARGRGHELSQLLF